MNWWLMGALVLSLISPIAYTKSMLAGKSRPHRVTRFVVWLACLTALLGVLNSPNTAGLVFAIIGVARSTYLLVLSGVYGVGGSSRLDRQCLLVAVSALAVYLATGKVLLAILLAILAEFAGHIPTLVKTWHEPRSEDPLFFITEMTAAGLGVCAIWEMRADILFPVYLVLANMLMVWLLYRHALRVRIQRFSRTA